MKIIHTTLLSASLLLALPGAAPAKNPSPKPSSPSPVVFSHPDELRAGDGFMVLADRRVFAIMAFLNATGFDEQPKGVAMHPVRQLVRQRLAENLAAHPEKLRQWRLYSQTNHLVNYTCLNYALSLEADYPFQRIRPDSELWHPEMTKLLRNAPEVLCDFWITAGLTNIWNEVKPAYVAELDKYDMEKSKSQMAFLWEYLRMPRRDTMTLVHVPDLLDTYYHAIGTSSEKYYYCVESPGSHSYGLNFHEYLHSVVNPLVKARFAAHREKLLPYYQSGKTKPLAHTYQDPVIFTYECLVRALDSRIQARWTTRWMDRPDADERMVQNVARLSDQGLTLTQPFYEQLAAYEAGQKPFDVFLPELLAHLPACPR